jgi:prepilin peptidase CpaA
MSPPSALFMVAMLAVALDDVWRRRVSNVVVVPTLLVGLAVGARGGGAALAVAAASALGATLLFIVPFACRMVGGGDVKLAAAVAAWLGPVDAALALALACVVAAVIGALMMVADAALLFEVVGNLQRPSRLTRAPERPRLQALPFGAALAFAACAVSAWRAST